jgi:pimeloyl-ACP methyl ester carboxylesterase
MTVVLVHGLPETAQIWDPLRQHLGDDSVALALPGFGVPRPAGFSATKDAYAEWLAGTLAGMDGPVDVVGHDIGALITLRVVTAFDVAVRSYAVDVADIFHPDLVWPDRVRQLQTPDVGERLTRVARERDPTDPASTAARLAGAGVPVELAKDIGAAYDETMSRCILDFYRSAVPNVAADWWKDVKGPTPAHGLVLLLPDPPEDEQRSVAVADRLGARVARLDGLEHCWMAQAPGQVAEVLQRFWSSLPR